jgi:hypothetical protein
MKVILKGSETSGWFGPPKGTHTGGDESKGNGAIRLAQKDIDQAKVSLEKLQSKSKPTKSDKNMINSLQAGVKSLEKRIDRYRAVGAEGLTGRDLAEDGFIRDGQSSSVSSLLSQYRAQGIPIPQIVSKLIAKGYVESSKMADLTQYLS